MDLNDLRSFIHVAQLGTITAAAATEGVPKSTISRRIARLEEQLGVALLHRSARSITITDDGRRLLERTSGALGEIAAAGRDLREVARVPSGRLVFTSVPDVGRSEAIASLIVEYRRRYPEVVVEARYEHRVVDLIQEGVDVALRAHEGEIPGSSDLMSRRLGFPKGGLYASPEYLARRGTPAHPDELASHDMLMHTAIRVRGMSLSAGEETMNLAELEPVCEANDNGFLQLLAELGSGIALLPAFAAARAVQGGRVVQLLEGWSTSAGKLTLVWPASRHLAPRVRTFVDLASERLAGVDWL